MPYRVKEGQTVYLVMAHSSKNKVVVLSRTIDFTKKELVASPMSEHHSSGIRTSPYMDFDWGFDVIEKWRDGEHANEVLQLFAEEVHQIGFKTDKKATTVIVPGSKGNQYTVTMDDNGFAINCSCPAYRFKHFCKHCSYAEQDLQNGTL